jgi:hypothetical protein
MPQVAIEFSLLSEFLGPVLTTNQIAKDCIQDTLKNGPVFTICKMSEFIQKSLLSGVEKHHDFQVTRCLHFDTTNDDFAYIKSE